jgi:NAD(P) transhydrogenase
MVETQHYDLVVIGSGPAGEKGAAQAAYFGKKVALVEKQPELGGACANTGTLPSKTLRESALFLSGLLQREIFGIERAVHTMDGLSIDTFMVQKDHVVRRERERIGRNIDRHKIDLVQGLGTIIDPHTVRVSYEGQPIVDLHADFILVATGSSPYRPKEIPFEDPYVDDSDEILRLEDIPRKLIVVGGGVIGSEYASIFAALGTTKVTLIDRTDRLLGFLDEELGDRLTDAFRRLGIEVILQDSVVKFEKPGETGVRVTLKSGRVMDADRLLAAAGRSGNTRNLGLAEVGVKLDERGRIIVNESFQTSVPHIYAAGDVIGFPSLASTSMEQGRVAMCHAFQLAYKTRMAEAFPYGLYTIPEVSMVGETEEGARKKGIDVEVGRAFYKDNARGQIINDMDGLIKLVFEAPTRKLIGVHILGERATELVHVGQAVIAFGGTIDYFIQTVFNYPTLSDAYKYAAYDGLGRLAKRGK